MVTRRGFLGAMLAAASAPAFVRAESLMKIMVPSKEIILNDAVISEIGLVPGGIVRRMGGYYCEELTDHPTISISFVSPYGNKSEKQLFYEMHEPILRLMAGALPRA